VGIGLERIWKIRKGSLWGWTWFSPRSMPWRACENDAKSQYPPILKTGNTTTSKYRIL